MPKPTITERTTLAELQLALDRAQCTNLEISPRTTDNGRHVYRVEACAYHPRNVSRVGGSKELRAIATSEHMAAAINSALDDLQLVRDTVAKEVVR